jgi:hypothetical protein
VRGSEVILPVRPSRKLVSRPEKDSQTKKRTDRTTEEKDSGNLFLESDDEQMVPYDYDAEIDGLDQTMTLRSTRGSQTRKSQIAKQQKKVPSAVVIDDDSDDAAAFRGFEMKTKITSRR